MTLNNSFSKLIKEDMKKRSWLFAVYIFAFALRIPLFMLTQADSRIFDLARGGVLTNEVKEVQYWFESIMGFQNFYIICIVIIGGIISGITAFSMLHSKEQVDFYYSLPVKRETWFSVSFVSSMIQFIVPYVAGYLALFMCGMLEGIATQKVISEIFIVMGFTILFFLLIFSITSLAMILTGKLLCSVMMIAVLMFYGSFLGALYHYTMAQGFETYSAKMFYHNNFLLAMIKENGWGSPIFSYLKFAERMKEGMDEISMIKAAMILIFICALVITLSFVLYKIRSMESAGNALAFPRSEPVIKVLIAVSLSLFLGISLSSLNYEGRVNGTWLFLIGGMSTILVCAVIEFIYRTDIGLVFKKKVSMAVSFAIVFLAMSILYFDLFGYNSYLPDQDQIESMGINYRDMNLYLLQPESLTEEEYFDIMENYSTKDISPVYEIAKEGISKVGKKKDNKKDEFVNIVYYLKDGRVVYRNYYVSKQTLFENTSDLLADETYRNKRIQQKVFETEQISQIHIRDMERSGIEIHLTEKQKEEFFQTYKEEVLEQSLGILKNESPVAVMYLTYSDGRYSNYIEPNYYIYGNYKKTLALLQEYGYEIKTMIDPSNVEEIQYQDKADHFQTVTDPDKIRKMIREVTLTRERFLDDSDVERKEVEISFRNGNVDSYYMKNIQSSGK